jgi:predicted TIM-barrel fold metal-dependent hydrolase
MPSAIFERFRVIDVDTHVTEPPDLWTSRVATKWGDRVPHIERDERGHEVWMAGDQRIGKPGSTTMAGFDGLLPDSPATFADIPSASYDAAERVRFMDANGIYAQVLYPNVGGFGSGSWLRLGDMDLVMECVRAYNDFLVDWSSVAPDRLLPICTTPFWDMDLALAEIERSLSNGHRAVNFCNQPQDHGLPPLVSRHWDPIWAAAQEAGVPISFHIGGGDIGSLMEDPNGLGWKANFAQVSSLILLGNIRCISDLVFGGICHRFPDLRFVSVESGVGWIPGILETFDWQWRNGGVREEHPEYDLLPSEYFRRQIYGCFWFERAGAEFAVEQFPDNVLYETDFPHPTCQHPGPRTPGIRPSDYADAALANLSDDVLRKVLHDNAATLYGVKG